MANISAAVRPLLLDDTLEKFSLGILLLVPLSLLKVVMLLAAERAGMVDGLSGWARGFIIAVVIFPLLLLLPLVALQLSLCLSRLTWGVRSEGRPLTMTTIGYHTTEFRHGAQHRRGRRTLLAVSLLWLLCGIASWGMLPWAPFGLACPAAVFGGMTLQGYVLASYGCATARPEESC